MSTKRPTSHYSISKTKDLSTAIKWENECIKEFNNLYTTVFDPMLDLIKISDNNDKLNDLIKQWKMWKWHINNNLNGKIKRNQQNLTMNKLIKNGKLILGKLYFGRSIELPEIKSHLEKSKVNNTIDAQRLKKLNKNHFYFQPIQIDDRMMVNNKSDVSFEKFYSEMLRNMNNRPRQWQLQNKIGKIPTLKEMEIEIVKRRKAKLLQELNL